MKKNRILLLIMVLSVALRLATAVYLGDTIEGEQQVRAFDQHSYNALAQSLLAGRGYSFESDWYPGFTRANTPTAHWSFLYPLYLAVVYFFTGTHPLAARLIQVVLTGILEPLLIYTLGRRLFGEKAGLLGAGLGAVYLFFIFYDATLMTEPFFILCVLGGLALALRLAEETGTHTQGNRWREWADWALLGLTLGIGALLRQTMLVWAPVLLGWILWRRRGRKQAEGGRGWAGAGLSLGVLVLMIAPWTIRNAVVYHAFLPLNSNAGYALYSANHPEHGTRFDQDYAAPLPEEWLGQDLNEAQWNTVLTRRGMEFMLQDPLRYLRLTLNKATVFFNFWFSGESTLVSNLMRVLSFGVYLPFFLLGLALAWKERQKAMVVYLFGVVFAGLHLLSWASARYRLPIDAALMPFAALAILRIFQEIKYRTTKAPRHQGI